MSCQTPTLTRLYRGKISKTAKKFSGKGAKREETDVNEAIISWLGMGLNKIPFYRRLFRPQSRSQGRG